ncbi:MAG: hypothetical protein N3A63_06210 [Bacteroidetes bacterium]|nr:hypothetical protein [Bacteroidota bacterium]
MKRYLFIGIALGVAIAFGLWIWKKHLKVGDEYEELYDSSTAPRELFGDAFKTVPDKL